LEVKILWHWPSALRSDELTLRVTRLIARDPQDFARKILSQNLPLIAR
jgi:hypothetical protein